MTTRPLEEWGIGALKPYAKNVKIHTKEQVAKIARSIEKHGLVNPPNVEPDGTLISGHGRLLALKQLGWKRVPVFVRHDLSKAEAAAARIADNKVAEGDTDTNMLQDELRWLESESVGDLTDLGFDDRELAFLTEDIGALDAELLDAGTMAMPDEVEHEAEPEEIEEPKTVMVPVAKALGFKEVTLAESRAITRFMATIGEQMDEEEPVAAFMAFVEGVMA